MGLDHQWLGFFQHETGGVFVQYNAGGPDPFHTYGQGRPINLFDPRGQWLIDHQNARPYGTEMVPPEEESTEEKAGGEGGEQAAPAKSGAVRSARMPLDFSSRHRVPACAHGRAAAPAGLVIGGARPARTAPRRSTRYDWPTCIRYTATWPVVVSNT